MKTVAILRTPIFPFSDLNNINKNPLKDFFSNDFFLKAVFISSPFFYNQLTSWINDKENSIKEKDAKNIIHTAYCYYARACYRCTPYGLFSLTSSLPIEFDNKTTTNVCVIDKEIEFKVEMDSIINALILESLKKDKTTIYIYKFIRNFSVYKIGDISYYINYKIIDHKYIEFELASFETNKIAEHIFDFCNEKRTIKEIVEHINNVEKNIEKSEIISFINELIDSNLLIFDIESKIPSKTPLTSIFEYLQSKDCNNKALKTKLNLLNELNSCLKKINLSNIIEHNSIIANYLEKLQISISKDKSYFHIDSTRKVENKVLIDKRLQIQLLEIRNIYNQIYHFKNERLNLFKKTFLNRYGSKKMLLLHVLDPINGIGYIQQNEDFGNLKEVKGLPKAFSRTRDIKLSEFEVFLIRKLKNFELTDNCIDISSYKTNNIGIHQKNYKSLMAFTKILKNGNLFLREINEISATRYMNRFSSDNQDLLSEMKEISKYEESCNFAENKVLVEFVHLPEIRMANLIQHDHFKQYQFGFIIPSDNATIIPINEVFIQINNDNIVLTSKNLDKEIIPSFSNSLNPHAYPLNIYNFLYDLQGETNNFELGFSWGELELIYNYFPRVKYKNIIISPALWILTIEEISNIKQLISSGKIPSKVFICDKALSDEQLYIDFDIEISNEVFFSTLKKKKRIYAYEIIENEDTFIINNEGKEYQHELMIPIVNNEYIPEKSELKNYNSINDKYIPGTNWLYLKIYCTRSTANELISNFFTPFFDSKVNSGILRKWFFLRYFDEDYHLRVRLDIIDEVNFIEIYNSFVIYLEYFLKNNLIFKIVIDTYERELFRYNYQDIIYIEEIFYYDSLIVTEFYTRNLKSKFEFAVLGIENYCNLFKIDNIQKEMLLTFLSNSLFKEFNVNKEFKIKLDERYRALSKNSPFSDSSNKELKKIFFKYENKLKIQIESICISKWETHKTYNLVSDLVHMFLNRLFSTNPRYNEMFVYYMLFKHYKGVNAMDRKRKIILE